MGLRSRAWRLAFFPIVVIAVVVPVVTPPANAMTKAEVEIVCADSRQAYDDYQAARAGFGEATEDLETANVALDVATAKEERIRSQYDTNRAARESLQPEVESEAVSLYMQAVGTGTARLVALDQPADAIVALQFISSNTDNNMQALNDLTALTSTLDLLGGDLTAAVDERKELRDQQQALTDRQEAAMGAALDSYDQLTDECKRAQADYEAEQARLRAEEEERKRRDAEARERASRQQPSGGGSRGGSSQVVGGIICPFTPGRTQFSNSWGAPRSGGRSHRGVDMFAPRDEPIFAVESGTISTDNGGLGGKQIMLRANSGRRYYYAHLNGFAVSTGASVSQGELIGYNGNSGNAAGASPHVHFQIYTSGSSGVINPYNSVAAVCF